MLETILRKLQRSPANGTTTPTEPFDRAIYDYIEEAVCQLKQEGIEAESSSDDPLIVSAVECYVKAQIDYDGRADWYEKQWEKRKGRLMLDTDYTEGDKDA